MKNYRMTVAFLTNEADVKKAKELAKAKPTSTSRRTGRRSNGQSAGSSR